MTEASFTILTLGGVMDWMAVISRLDAGMGLRALAAFVGVALLIPLLLPLANRLRLHDVPGGRKQHELPTPYIGGAVIMLVMAACFLVFDVRLSGQRLYVFLLGSAILIAVGLVDDRVGLSARVRIAAQVLVALLLVFVADMRIENLDDVFGVANVSPWIGVPFTVFVVVGVINAINMIDGSDGLGAGQVLAAFVLYAAFALYAGQFATVDRMLIGVGAVAGFLFWNMRLPWQRRARVFLGNAGSMFLGLVIAWTAIRLTQDASHPVSPVLGPWALAIPLLDCVTLMFARFFAGRSPFAADRNHLHHLLLDAGYRPGSIALGLMVVSLAIGTTAGLVVKAGVYRPLVVIAFLVVLVAWYFLFRDRDRAVSALRRLRGGPAMVGLGTVADGATDR